MFDPLLWSGSWGLAAMKYQGQVGGTTFQQLLPANPKILYKTIVSLCSSSCTLCTLSFGFFCIFACRFTCFHLHLCCEFLCLVRVFFFFVFCCLCFAFVPCHVLGLHALLLCHCALLFVIAPCYFALLFVVIACCFALLLTTPCYSPLHLLFTFAP